MTLNNTTTVTTATTTYIPLLAQHCSQIHTLHLSGRLTFTDEIANLCRVNPLLQVLWNTSLEPPTDIALIELIHACPHLHTLYLPYETEITDISILALSEHCPHLEKVCIYYCKKVTEAAVLQLLQRCRKLTKLHISSSSLSKETWTKLDKNMQKRVRRY